MLVAGCHPFKSDAVFLQLLGEAINGLFLDFIHDN
jgi:hypothetical protein